jgi:uncharacterized protein YidB (DUF937 family)
MSFLEQMAGRELESILSGSSNPLVSGVLQFIDRQPGGLSGLVQQFHDKGLGSLVSSWVGTGQNLPISSDQLQQVFGSEPMRELAAKAGISPEAAGSHLAQLLPLLVDKLTPTGQVPQSSTASMLQAGLDALKGLGKTGIDP